MGHKATPNGINLGKGLVRMGRVNVDRRFQREGCGMESNQNAACTYMKFSNNNINQ